MTGSGASGIQAQSTGTGVAGNVSVTANGTVSAQLLNGHGIVATADNGTVTVVAKTVLAAGVSGIGVDAHGSSSTSVELDQAQGGSINGTGVSFGFVGTTSTLVVRASGAIGALSDRALLGSDGKEQTTMNGQMLGYGSLNAGDDELTVTSGGSVFLRNFADTDGDGTRDLIGTATLDFGTGTDTMTINAGGTLGVATAGSAGNTGIIDQAEQLNSAGLITLQNLETGGATALAGDRLLTRGNYASTGGTLHVDSLLDGGGPGVQTTDRFLVDGNATGVTLVSVNNAGGAGGETGTGNTGGISIVQVGGTAAADSFQLAGPVVAGAYEYSLVAFDPLQSSVDQKDPLLTAGDFWDYRLQTTFFAGVADYSGLPQGGSLLAQAALNAVLQRPSEPPAIAAPGQTAGQEQLASLGVGDLQEAVRPTAGDGVSTGVWLAAFGEGLEVTPDGGADFDQDNYGIQAGYDLFGWRGVFGSDDFMILGVLGTIAQGKLNFSDSDTEMNVGLYGGGLYAAYDFGGLRVNAVAQVLSGNADITSPLSGIDTSTNVTTLGLGLGVVHRFDFGQLFLEPGADLRYVHAWSADNFQDASDADITLDNTNSLIARGNLKLGLSFDNVAPYLSVGVAQEFLGNSSATVDGLGFDTSTQGHHLRGRRRRGRLGARLQRHPLGRCQLSLRRRGPGLHRHRRDQGFLVGGVRV